MCSRGTPSSPHAALISALTSPPIRPPLIHAPPRPAPPQGLDYVLDQARLRGMRVLLTLTDYFADGAGGPLQYLQFAGVDVNNPSDELKAQFFTNGQAQALFQQYISLLVGRVNTVNGRTYKSDPTIFGWDVMNEVCVSGMGEEGGREVWMRHEWWE